MIALPARDLRASLDLVNALVAADADLPAFARAGVEALPRLVASEITTLSVCNLHDGRREVFAAHPETLGATERACFDRFFGEHPLVRYHADLGGAGAHRISDSLPWQRFRHSALYSEYYRRIGIDHVVALPLHLDRNTLVSFVLNRSRRDFSDREVALLNLIRLPLAHAYRQTCALHAAQLRIDKLSAQVGQAVDRPRPQAWGVAAGAGAAATLTVREREVMRWLAAAKTDRDIAALIDCSVRTVQKHLERIYTKLGVENRTAAVMRSITSAPSNPGSRESPG